MPAVLEEDMPDLTCEYCGHVFEEDGEEAAAAAHTGRCPECGRCPWGDDDCEIERGR